MNHTDDRLRAAAQRALESLCDLILDTPDPSPEATAARLQLEEALAAASAVLPEPTSRAAVRAAALLEAADFVGNDDDCECGGCDTCVPRYLADGLRRLAGEAHDTGTQQQDEATTVAASGPRANGSADPVAEAQQQPEGEAHPAEHTWAAELYDPATDEWAPTYTSHVRDRAVAALEHGRRIGPTWKDGTPTRRRLVRATTTYTVEEPAPAEQQPAAADDEETSR